MREPADSPSLSPQQNAHVENAHVDKTRVGKDARWIGAEKNALAEDASTENVLTENVLVITQQNAPRCRTFDYAIIRLVPRVERDEFLNVGAIVFCAEQGFLASRIELDEHRVLAFAPRLDLTCVQEHLDTIARVCAGKNAGAIGALSQRERFHWLVAPRSTMIQTSPTHCGLGDNPQNALDDLFFKMVAALEGGGE